MQRERAGGVWLGHLVQLGEFFEGLDAVLRGLSMVCTDHQILDLTSPMFPAEDLLSRPSAFVCDR